MMSETVFTKTKADVAVSVQEVKIVRPMLSPAVTLTLFKRSIGGEREKLAELRLPAGPGTYRANVTGLLSDGDGIECDSEPWNDETITVTAGG